MTIAREHITGLVRAVERDGVDLGLKNHHGMPRALHVVLRLSPQVGEVAIHANRNIAAYESMGAAVWPDDLTDHPSPLVSLLTGLERCETPYLVSVCGDMPEIPHDLVERLAEALVREDVDIAMPVTRADDGTRRHSSVRLMKADLAESLRRHLHGGTDGSGPWIEQQRCVEVLFDDPAAFAA